MNTTKCDKILEFYESRKTKSFSSREVYNSLFADCDSSTHRIVASMVHHLANKKKKLKITSNSSNTNFYQYREPIADPDEFISSGNDEDILKTINGRW